MSVPIALRSCLGLDPEPYRKESLAKHVKIYNVPARTDVETFTLCCDKFRGLRGSGGLGEEVWITDGEMVWITTASR